MTAFDPDFPVHGQRKSTPAEKAAALTLGPIPGKDYKLARHEDSGFIKVSGWKFRFGRPHMTFMKNGRGYFEFSVYIESPPMAALAGRTKPVLPIAMVFRGMRIKSGQLAAPVRLYAPGKFMTLFYFNKTLADLLLQAVKKWKIVSDNPELTPEGTRYPLNRLAYSKSTVTHAMSPFVPWEGKKSE